ncbi:unnamed protein product [Ectocarpus sp. CCAP 1310/34]|nr:unnamed protein product [Ectocarpus sp. CCAP 1310/34]
MPLRAAWSALFVWATLLVALAVALPAAPVGVPPCTSVYVSLVQQSTLALHAGTEDSELGMEGSGSYVDPKEASDDEDDDAEFDMGPSYKPLYAANSHRGLNMRGAARRQRQQSTTASPVTPPLRTVSREPQQLQLQRQQRQQQHERCPPEPSPANNSNSPDISDNTGAGQQHLPQPVKQQQQQLQQQQPASPDASPANSAGLPRDESSEPYTRRNKHPGRDKFSLSDDLKASLPKVDKAGLSALRSFVNGKGQALPFTFFEKTFPKEAQDIVLKESLALQAAEIVSSMYVNFCADESDPPPEHQEDRHRRKKVVRGFQEVPSKEMADGSREYAFERKHLYGVMGILITTRLTKKPRIIDYWGVEAHDNYPLVRACMPRDLFILFYGRFFHLAPPTGKLNKDDPQYDSKHHIRCAP